MNFRPLFAIAFLIIFAGYCHAGTQVKNTGDGYQIGTSATEQKIGFFAATPVVQPTSASQAAVTNSGSTNVILTVSSGAAPSLALASGAAPSLALSGVVFTNLNVLCGDGSTQSVYVATVAMTALTNTAITADAPLTNATLTAAAPVTNVTVNTVWGSTSATHANGVTTLVNAIRTALVNLGLLKGS